MIRLLIYKHRQNATSLCCSIFCIIL